MSAYGTMDPQLMVEALPDPPEWHVEAECREPWVDGEWFFVESTHMSKTNYSKIRQAKRVCDLCVVAEDCLEGAMSRKESQGIWGGTTPGERRSLVRNPFEPNGLAEKLVELRVRGEGLRAERSARKQAVAGGALGSASGRPRSC